MSEDQDTLLGVEDLITVFGPANEQRTCYPLTKISVTAQSFCPSLEALNGITSGPVIKVDNGQMARSHVKSHGPPARQAAAPDNQFRPED